ncbi:S-adenosylmethionine synthetase [Thermocladium modestius]|uniref:S-adenosylmethionine synthase n=1 Tax=Thermocladium modestius TaxID=62609 RepID=A0A830GXU8_9CREN|nr:methionine adenosyltransferase [Thermocladium modestius]GGP21916.1 S-adenosylmethionine synthetase [Thermocladium modestius]
MRNIVVSNIDRKPVEEQPVELVERKGLGHPDYISDAISEAASRELSKYYLKEFGTILHHNLDKVLLVGGQASPRFGGGNVIHPIYIHVAGRATTEVKTNDGVFKIPIGPIILSASKKFIKNNFRFLNPDDHVVINYSIGPGSADLVGVYELGAHSAIPLANDTSIGVGFAPLSVTERLAMESERLLNSREFKLKYPEVGEDVKVMALRQGKSIKVTIAAAFISSLVKDKDHYLSVKEEVKRKVEDLAAKIAPGYDVSVFINTADKPENGIFYITVTGTSAEHGDDGMTGRGNRANGLITPMRPMTMEAAAGKNPVNHIGKIYNVFAPLVASRLYKEIPGMREVYVYLLSQIGKPIDQPLIANVEIIPEKELTGNMKQEAQSIMDEELSRITRMAELILNEEATLY